VTANLRRLLATGETLIAPGASDALSARLIEAHGYKCVYIGSYATAASRCAIPDTGLLSLEQLASHARTVAAAVRVPVIADAEGGFDPQETTRLFEAAGVAAIHIEDHTGAGKHTSGPQELRWGRHGTHLGPGPKLVNDSWPWSRISLPIRATGRLSDAGR
jgi:2-methylisocitrate lyase-like PEP mutase family enzyme